VENWPAGRDSIGAQASSFGRLVTLDRRSINVGDDSRVFRRRVA
jgi:hypothetical protein